MLTCNKASLSAEAGNIVRALASGSLPNGLATFHVAELPRSPVRGVARPSADAGQCVPRPEQTLPKPSGCNGSRERRLHAPLTRLRRHFGLNGSSRRQGVKSVSTRCCRCALRKAVVQHGSERPAQLFAQTARLWVVHHGDSPSVASSLLSPTPGTGGNITRPVVDNSAWRHWRA